MASSFVTVAVLPDRMDILSVHPHPAGTGTHGPDRTPGTPERRPPHRASYTSTMSSRILSMNASPMHHRYLMCRIDTVTHEPQLGRTGKRVLWFYETACGPRPLGIMLPGTGMVWTALRPSSAHHIFGLHHSMKHLRPCPGCTVR